MLWLLLLAYIGMAIGFLIVKEGLHDTSKGPRSSSYYLSMLILAGLCLCGLAACAAVYAVRLRRMVAQRRAW